MAKKPSTRKAVRSAITGQFLDKSKAKKWPSTTVTETIKITQKKGKNKMARYYVNDNAQSNGEHEAHAEV